MNLFDYGDLPGILNPRLLPLRPNAAPVEHLSPQMAPINGAQQMQAGPPSARPRSGGGIRNAIGTLFGGADDPNLTPEQNRQARRMAMLQSGLRTIQAASQPGATGLGSIAEGALYGQQVGTGMRQKASVESEQNRMRQLMADAARNPGETIPKLLGMFNEAMANGDVKAATTIGTVLQSAYAAQPKAADERPRAPVYGTPEYYEALDRELALRNKHRPPTIGSGRTDGPRPRASTEGERRAAAFAQFIPDHVQFIRRVTSSPGRVQQILSKKGLGELTSDEQQQLDIAAGAVAEAWLRLTTGASYNEHELANARRMFMPQPGDKKTTIEMKHKNLERLMQMLNGLSGATPQGGTSTAAPVIGVDPFADLGN